MIHNLPSPKTTKKSKILGRGQGSGVGNHTVGRGTKGQKSRSGYKAPRPGFEGGQMPLSRRLPKLRGSVSGRSRKFFQAKENNYVIRLSQLENLKDGDVNPVSLLMSKLTKATGLNPTFKVLFDKEIKTKLNVNGVAVSKTAQAAIEKAGGTIS